MSEEEIVKEHGQALSFIGQKVYQFMLPLLEIHDALGRVLQLNREMYNLKQKEKEPAKPAVAVVPDEQRAPADPAPPVVA